jgi:hypothetical protein
VLKDGHAAKALGRIELQDKENQSLYETLCSQTFAWAKAKVQKNDKNDLD